MPRPLSTSIVVPVCLILCLLSANQSWSQTESKPGSIMVSEDQGKPIFKDSFDRSESQEEKDEPGNGWKTNSGDRAKGNKQVDLKDGALHIYRHADADHAVTVKHAAEFKNGSVEIKFMLPNQNDVLGLNFADPQCKEVHAGHLFRVSLATNFVELADLKTGAMNLKIRELKQSKKMTKQQERQLKSKTKRFQHKLQSNQWYTAVASVDGKGLSVTVDGQLIGVLRSPGISHPTKKLLRLNVAKKAIVDEVEVFSHPDTKQPAQASSDKPLKVLLVAGGCCHDYDTQATLLKKGIESKINAVVTVAYSDNRTTRAKFEIYEKDDWAVGYDVILHDECSADVTKVPYVNRILNAHLSGVPAVNIHCAMHSYRWGDFRKAVEPGAGNAGWYEMLGLQSTGHGPKFPIQVDYAESDSLMGKGLVDWKTANEELYNNIRVFSQVEVVATGNQIQPPNKRQLEKNPEAKPKNAKAVVAWTNLYGPNKTRIFSTSLGHENKTVADDRYMDLVVQGLLWTTDNLTADGKPKKSYLKTVAEK